MMKPNGMTDYYSNIWLTLIYTSKLLANNRSNLKKYVGNSIGRQKQSYAASAKQEKPFIEPFHG